jgi:hypothetical protein
MSAEPQALAPAYTCNICRKTLMLKGPPIVGETPQRRLEKVGQMLMDHMGKEHREAIVNIMLAGQQLSGWLTAEQYTHNDAQLAAEANKVRLKMRQFTKRVEITDEMIQTQVDTHLGQEGLDAATMRSVAVELLKTMRDKLEEVPEPKLAA